MNNNQTFTCHGTLPLILSLLNDVTVIPITPIGNSMFPFFHGGRDTLFVKKAIHPLKRGDIVLYQREDKTYVVHRIHHVINKDNHLEYYMLGDHQTWIEGPLLPSSVHGVVSYYKRKGKIIDCTANKTYKLLWQIWMFLRPIRPLCLKIWGVIRRILIPN